MTIPLLKHSSLVVLINRSLRMVVKIYREQRRLLVKELKLIDRVRRNPKTGQKKRDDLWSQKKLYVQDFRQHLIITAFLMMHSYLEEALLIVSPDEEKPKIPTRKTGIEKSKNAFKAHMGIILPDHSKWQDLKDFSKIRHLILHANANVNLAKNSEEIESILQRQAKFIFRYKGSLCLKEGILQHFEHVLDDFVRWILDEKQKCRRRRITIGSSGLGNWPSSHLAKNDSTHRYLEASGACCPYGNGAQQKTALHDFLLALMLA